MHLNEGFYQSYFVVTHGLQFDHVLGWWKQRDDPNILILTYEDRVQVRNHSEPFIARFALGNASNNPPFCSEDFLAPNMSGF